MQRGIFQNFSTKKQNKSINTTSDTRGIVMWFRWTDPLNPNNMLKQQHIMAERAEHTEGFSCMKWLFFIGCNYNIDIKSLYGYDGKVVCKVGYLHIQPIRSILPSLGFWLCVPWELMPHISIMQLSTWMCAAHQNLK